MLEVSQLQFTYGDKQLFNNVSFKVFQNEHVGLMGPNGCGKTTLMNILAHKIAPDSGSIAWDATIAFSYLDQHLKVSKDVAIYEYLYDVYAPLFLIEKQMNELYDQLGGVDPSLIDKTLEKAERLMQELEDKDFYRIKSKISDVISGLGINVSQNRKLAELSSGQRAKVFLGKMLLEEKKTLLLDEPTNFLDAHHIEWLVRYLQAYPYGYIVISHDMSFLNKVSDVVLMFENKQINRYRGNVDKALEQQTQALASYEKQYEKQQQ